MIIGLLGMKQSGKDTTADYLVEKYNYEKMAFADSLKDVLKILFQFTDNQLNGDLKEVVDERWGITPRFAMQYFGTEMIRKRMKEIVPWIEENFWVKNAEIKIDKKFNDEPSSKIIFTDIRFPNEAKLIKEKNGIIIKILRPEIKREDTHASEILVDHIGYDHSIVNDGSLEDLNNKIEEIIRVCPSFI